MNYANGESIEDRLYGMPFWKALDKEAKDRGFLYIIYDDVRYQYRVLEDGSIPIAACWDSVRYKKRCAVTIPVSRAVVDDCDLGWVRPLVCEWDRIREEIESGQMEIVERA
jgi:hypothetical protein